jgi:hypothetical protein
MRRLKEIKVRLDDDDVDDDDDGDGDDGKKAMEIVDSALVRGLGFVAAYGLRDNKHPNSTTTRRA